MAAMARRVGSYYPSPQMGGWRAERLLSRSFLSVVLAKAGTHNPGRLGRDRVARQLAHCRKLPAQRMGPRLRGDDGIAQTCVIARVLCGPGQAVA